MAVTAPNLPIDDLREQALELIEEGVSSAAKAIGPLAERASSLELEKDLRSTAGRVAEEAEDLLTDLERASVADRRAVLGLAVVAAVVTVILVVIARRRRASSTAQREGDRS